jgi:predicted MFS family arabinose efflux permease
VAAREGFTRQLSFQVGLFAAARLLMTIGYRMVYPFLPALARGLGVELRAVTLAVTARSALGLAGPLLGTLGDVRGRRLAMLAGLGLFSVGMGLVFIWPVYPALFAALLCSGAGKLIFDSAMQAYLGDRIHYARRGRVLAVVEMSWSMAFFLGIPVVGWLIARGGWQVPFRWLALLGAIMLLVLWRLLDPDGDGRGETGSTAVAGLRVVLGSRLALAGLALGVLITMANELVAIVYGLWMETSFGLQVTALGLASIVIGAAEMAGEGLVAALVDHIGKRRAVGGGIVLTAFASLALPFISQSTAGVLVGLFLFYLMFEFTIVASIPLVSELAPGARATMMAAYGSACSAGRMLGALAGPALYGAGMIANGGAAVALNLLALAVLVFLLRVE